MTQQWNIAELKGELERRLKEMDRLIARREKVAAQLDEIDSKIAELVNDSEAPASGKASAKTGKKGKRAKKAGKKATKKAGVKKAKKASRGGGLAKSTGTGRKLPKNEKPLPEYIREVLGKGPMRTKDIAKAVQEAGYKTNSKDFYGIVAQALRAPDLFERQGRGVYGLKD